MKTYLILLFTVSSLYGCSQMSIGKISYMLGKKQNDKMGKFKQNTFYQIREKLLDKYPEIFGGKIDTLYFIEKYEVEDASYYGIIWSSTDTVNYIFSRNEIRLAYKKFFSMKAISLISIWDVLSIKKEEEKYGNTVKYVYAAKVVVKNNKCLVDTITMKDIIFD